MISLNENFKNEDYKDLIDLALDLKDFKWAKELSEKVKLNDTTKEINNKNNRLKKNENNYYIALMDMEEDSAVIKVGNGVTIPTNTEESNRQLYLVKSLTNKKQIKKNEKVSLIDLDEDEQYFYKIAYNCWFEGYTIAYNYCNENLITYENTIKELESKIKEFQTKENNYKILSEAYRKQFDMQNNIINDQNKTIKDLESKNENNKTKKWWKF